MSTMGPTAGRGLGIACRLALVCLFAATVGVGTALADSVYVVTAFGNFGTVNLSTGTFTCIATGDVINNAGIDETPAGNLYEYTGNDQLFSINPATGATTLIGTGSIPGFGFGSFITVGGLTTGAFYAMNWNGDLYSIDLTNGAATLIGSTGINLQSGGSGGVCEATGLSGSATTLYYVASLQPGCVTSNQAL